MAVKNKIKTNQQVSQIAEKSKSIEPEQKFLIKKSVHCRIIRLKSNMDRVVLIGLLLKRRPQSRSLRIEDRLLCLQREEFGKELFLAGVHEGGGRWITFRTFLKYLKTVLHM